MYQPAYYTYGMSHLLPLSFISTALFFGMPVAGAQRVIHVPGDLPTIQTGIDSALPGDVVDVSPGTYYEILNFNGKAITVEGAGAQQDVIIDALQRGTVVSFTNGEGRNSVLRNLTLRHGSPVALGAGGIYIQGAAPSITGVTISDSTGCGVGSYKSSPLIQNSVVTGTISSSGAGTCSAPDLASGFPAANGTGLFLVGQAGGGLQSIIEGNTVSDNESSSDGSESPGITVISGGSMLIIDNIVSGNTSHIAYGSGISLAGSTSAYVIQNLVFNNTEDARAPSFTTDAIGDEGGINLNVSPESTTFLTNDTVAYNQFINDPGRQPVQGTQLVVGNFGELIASNNLFIGMDSLAPVECGDPLQGAVPGKLIFQFNDAYTSEGPLAYDGGRCVGVAGANGNITVDPLFASETSSALDLRLQLKSPVIDAGDNTAVGVGPFDLVGAQRIQNAKGLAAAIIDMGAYEHAGVPAPPLAADFTLSASPTSVDLTRTSSATVMLTLLPNSSLQAQISSVCAGLPENVQCSFSPSVVSVSSGLPESVQLTLSVKQSSTQNAARAILNDFGAQRPGWTFVSSILTALLVPIPFMYKGRLRYRLSSLGICFITASLLLSLTACVHLNTLSQVSSVLVSAVANTGQHHSASLSVKSPVTNNP